jgi:hypothetical protein
MDAIPASAESYADRDLRLRALLRDGVIFDPERWLFLRLLDDLPAVLAAMPFLFDVSWGGGRFDLLFTDGRGTWCAVEVKDAPEIYDTGKARENRQDKDRKRRKHLRAQTEDAWLAACARFPGDVVLGLALWRTDEWVVLVEHGPWVELGACA